MKVSSAKKEESSLGVTQLTRLSTEESRADEGEKAGHCAEQF